MFDTRVLLGYFIVELAKEMAFSRNCTILFIALTIIHRMTRNIRSTRVPDVRVQVTSRRIAVADNAYRNESVSHEHRYSYQN